ncbi:MAG: DUF2723 domain-containing protein [Myxococcota bacterium]
MAWVRRHGACLSVLVVAAAAYVAMAATTVLWHDHGEYVTVADRGGVVHPPGYPLYVLWLRVWAWFPAANPVARTSFATAVLGVGALAVLYVAVRGFAVSRPAAAAATALFGLSSRATLTFAHAENLALNTLLAAALLAVAAPRSRLAPTMTLIALAALLGLGLANHHSIVLLAPLVAWRGWVVVRRVAPRRRVRAITLATIAFALGLTPYLALLGAHGADAWVWGRFDGPRDLVDHVLRREYGLALAPQRDGRGSSAWAQLAFLADTLARDSLWIFGLVGLGGLGGSLAAVRSAAGRRAAAGSLALMATLLTTGPLFVVWLNVSPRGVAGYEVARFHLLPSLIFSVFVGRGLHQLLIRLRDVRWRRVRASLAPVLAILACLFTVPDVTSIHRPTVEHYLRNTLETAPPDAVVLTSGDHRLFGYLYLQRSLGLRRDVTVVSPTMLFRPWYRERAAAELGVPSLPMVGTNTLDMAALAAAILETNRPLLVGNVGPNYAPILAAFPNEPFGALIRVLPPGTPPTRLPTLEAQTRALFAHHTFEPGVPRDRFGIGARVMATYARPWLFLAASYRELNQPERAAIAAAEAERFGVR